MTVSYSVIIPARNAARFIAGCIDSASALSPKAAEIIVVDDASEDETASIAAGKGARVIRSAENIGPGPARNLGARAAAGEFLAFTDSDCEVPADWLAKIDQAMAQQKYSAVTGPYAGATHNGLLALLMDRSLRFDQRNLPEVIESCISSNLCVRKSDFESIGGFPLYKLPGSPRYYFGNEDEELAHLLVRKTDLPVKWMRENGVYHGYRATLRGYFKQQARYAEAILVSYAKFPAMLKSQSNYSRGGGATKVLVAWLAIAGIVPAPVIWWSLAAILPFVILHLRRVKYLVQCESRIQRRIVTALAAYPFLLFTAMAWTKGLVTGSWKALRVLLERGKKRASRETAKVNA